MATANGHANGQLTAKQQKALAALMTQPTIISAAAAAGIGERTLHTWLHEPAFADAYVTMRHEAVQQAIGRLQNATGIAVDALLDIITSPDTPVAVRLTAAKAILDYAIHAVEIDVLESRIAALEAAQRVLGGEFDEIDFRAN